MNRKRVSNILYIVALVLVCASFFFYFLNGIFYQLSGELNATGVNYFNLAFGLDQNIPFLIGPFMSFISHLLIIVPLALLIWKKNFASFIVFLLLVLAASVLYFIPQIFLINANIFPAASITLGLAGPLTSIFLVIATLFTMGAYALAPQK